MKTTLITGASSGIGLELAKVFAENGYHLILVARSRAKMEALAAELTKAHGIQVRVIAQDLSDPGAPARVYDEVTKAGIAVDVLVNNAGFGLYGPFLETDGARELEMIRLNIAALTDLTKRFLPGMVSRRAGKILNVASTAAFQPGPSMAVYYATKAYVLSFSEAINHELKGTGVTVTALCPGPTPSGFQATAQMEGSRLLKLSMIDARTVAEIGFPGLMRNKAVVIPGLLNRMLAFSVRLMPRNVVTMISGKLAERSHADPATDGRLSTGTR